MQNNAAITFKFRQTPITQSLFHEKQILTNFFEFIFQALPCKCKW